MGSSQSSTNQEEGITENDGDLSTGQKAFTVGAIAGLAALEISKLVSDSTSTSESFECRSAKKLGNSPSSTNEKKGTEKVGALSADEKAGAVGAIAGLAALEIAKLVSGSTSTSESFRSRSVKKKGGCRSSTNYLVKRTGNDGDLSMDQKAAVTAGAIAGLSAWGVAKIVSGSSISTSTSGGQKKTMKAPGRKEWIDRDDFERDPAAYFKSLRN